MRHTGPITITPILVADLLAGDARMPVYVHVIDHPQARILVDTGMTDLHPAVADMDPQLTPLTAQDFDIAGIDIVVNTHLHFDHCGGNHLFAGKPIYVQRRELDDARHTPDYTLPEWVDAPGVHYIAVEGDHDLLPGLRLLTAPGHCDGMQIVVIDTTDGPLIVGGDVAVWHGELDQPSTPGQHRVRALNPTQVWLTHEHQPWRPGMSLAPPGPLLCHSQPQQRVPHPGPQPRIGEMQRLQIGGDRRIGPQGAQMQRPPRRLCPVTRQLHRSARPWSAPENAPG